MAHPGLRTAVAEHPAARALAAAAVGCAVVLLWWVVLTIWPGAVFSLVAPDALSCPEAPGWGCALGAALLGAVLGGAIIVGVGGGLVWWGLAMLGIRPTWAVTLLGLALTVVLASATAAALSGLASALTPAVVGYGSAALIIRPRSPRRTP